MLCTGVIIVPNNHFNRDSIPHVVSKTQTHLERDAAKFRRDSTKLFGLLAGAVIQLRRRSINPRSRTLEVRSTLYSAALRSAAQRLVRASSLASCSRFSRWAQFICKTPQKSSQSHTLPLPLAAKCVVNKIKIQTFFPSTLTELSAIARSSLCTSANTFICCCAKLNMVTLL